MEGGNWEFGSENWGFGMYFWGFCLAFLRICDGDSEPEGVREKFGGFEGMGSSSAQKFPGNGSRGGQGGRGEGGEGFCFFFFGAVLGSRGFFNPNQIWTVM